MSGWEVVIAIVTTSIAATWVLRDKLDELGKALTAHAQDDASKFQNLTGRVIELETRRRKRP